MTGGSGVVAVVMLEWAVGLVAVGAWTQSWGRVRRGHFRIIAWIGLSLALVALAATRSAFDASQPRSLVLACAVGAALYLGLQYVRTDVGSTVAGALTATTGAAAIVATGGLVAGWPQWLAAAELLAGAALLGGVTNGMLLGHWYLNQPGLEPGALARLTRLSLVATAASGALGVAASGKLVSASTHGAVLGLPGFGTSFGPAFFGIWVALVAFTGVVVWMARRCVAIRSIQSATGLYYVALLTAGVSEFLVRYLMLHGAP